MEQSENLHKYVIAVNAIMKYYGKMSDDDFITHVVTCCKEATELTTTPEEEIKEIEETIDKLKSLLVDKKRALFEQINQFDCEERVLVDPWGNGRWEEGIYLGNREERGSVIPMVAKIKKDGTKSKNLFMTTKWTKLKKK